MEQPGILFVVISLSFPWACASQAPASVTPQTSSSGPIIATYAGRCETGKTFGGYLQSPTHLVLDKLGNLFISGVFGVIERITPAGVMTRIVGQDNAPGYSGDSGPATSSRLHHPGGLASTA
jgi:hypothetical protein